MAQTETNAQALSIDDRIAAAMRSHKSPETPLEAIEQMKEGYALLGEMPLAAQHLWILLEQLKQEHEALATAHRDAPENTEEETLAGVAHLMNHEDTRKVRRALLKILGETFETDKQKFGGYQPLADWHVAGRPRSEEDDGLPGFMKALLSARGSFADRLKTAMGDDDSTEDSSTPPFGTSFFPDVFEELFGKPEGGSARQKQPEGFPGIGGSGSPLLDMFMAMLSGDSTESAESPSQPDEPIRIKGDVINIEIGGVTINLTINLEAPQGTKADSTES